MAISAKQPDIFSVRGPVLETAVPSVVAVFWPDLFRGVDVVNVDGTVIGETTFGAFAAKLGNQGEFSFPVASPFVNVVPMFVPVGLLALRLTEPSLGRLAAFLAFAAVGPAMSEIASLSAKLSAAVSQTIRMHRRRLSAVFADDLNWFSSHVSKYITLSERKYFDIACERISAAYSQGRLFA